MSDAPAERLQAILDLLGRAQEALDQAVGRAATLPIRERTLVRDQLVPPRTHLQRSADTLRRKVQEAEAKAVAEARERRLR